jgi:hypothetical protein
MSPTTNLVSQRQILRCCVAALVVVAACGMDPDPVIPKPPPTYTELYTTYFAPGTPGHCANTSCHNGPDFNVWMCGTSKDTCYSGMASVSAGLINPANPTASLIGDPKNSPLAWINLNGNMPFDNANPLPAGRDAILAWVAAGAKND